MRTTKGKNKGLLINYFTLHHKVKVIYQNVLLNRPWILKPYPVRFSTNKSFKQDLFPNYNTKSEKHVYLLLFGKSLSIRNALNSIDQSMPHSDADLRPENTTASLNSPGEAASSSLLHHLTTMPLQTKQKGLPQKHDWNRQDAVISEVVFNR